MEVGGQQLDVYVAGLVKFLKENPNEEKEEPKEIATLRANIERLTKTLQAAQADAGSIRAKLLAAAQ